LHHLLWNRLNIAAAIVKIARIVIALLLIAAGAIWIGQGLGYIGGSFMTGDPLWAWIGLGCTVLGVILLLAFRRRGT